MHFWPGWFASHLNAIYPQSCCECYQTCPAKGAATVYCSAQLLRFGKDGCEKKWNNKKMQCTNNNKNNRNSGSK